MFVYVCGLDNLCLGSAFFRSERRKEMIIPFGRFRVLIKLDTGAPQIVPLEQVRRGRGWRLEGEMIMEVSYIHKL